MRGSEIRSRGPWWSHKKCEAGKSKARMQLQPGHCPSASGSQWKGAAAKQDVPLWSLSTAEELHCTLERKANPWGQSWARSGSWPSAPVNLGLSSSCAPWCDCRALQHFWGPPDFSGCLLLLWAAANRVNQSPAGMNWLHNPLQRSLTWPCFCYSVWFASASHYPVTPG